MATQKERELMHEIMDLAVDIGAGDYDVCAEYHGHIHAFDARIAPKGSNEWVYYGDTVYLSGRTDSFKPAAAINGLTKILSAVKKYHKSYDSDGVKL